MITVQSRMSAVQTPVIPLVGQLIRDNPGTISLGQGVVYYEPPQEAIAGIQDFLKYHHNHQYKSVQGISPLVNRIVTKLQEENQITIGDNRAVVVTAGGNMAFMNAILAITNAGDEIILNTPYYFNHEMAIMMANCHPVLVSTDENYQLCLDQLEKAITPKTRAIVTISPNNPTGAVYPQATLERLNKICQDRGIYHISDEAYEYFTYNKTQHFSPASIINSETHTISLYSLSKAYGFASWRIGYMVVPIDLLEAVKKIQDTILICPPVISQYAALGALNVGKNYCLSHLYKIELVRKTFLNSLQSLTDICTIIPGDGAFYFFLKVQTEMNDFELVKQLIKNYQVAVLPGTTFGVKEGCYLRIAYGNLQQEMAREGIQRLVTGLREIVNK